MTGKSTVVADEYAGIVRDVQARILAAEYGRRAVVTGLRPFGDGHSGCTYIVEMDDGLPSLVLRLSARGARITGPNDVGRQGRVMRAARQAGIPAPPVLDCSSEQVIDGRSFALMERLDGLPWDAKPGLTHRSVAEQAVAVLRCMRAIEPARSGLQGEEVFSPIAELARWGALLPRCPDWLRAAAASLLSRLEGLAPEATRAALVHGDYHYGNLLFADGRVSAVFDWEIASLGEPLMDLGCLAVASLRRRYAPEPNPTGSVDVGTGDLADMYGVDDNAFGWFVAASCLKYSAILGYNLTLHRRGKRTDPIYDSLLETMRGLVDVGVSVLGAAR